MTLDIITSPFLDTPLTLVRPLASGGEGTVFLTQDMRYVVKVYHHIEKCPQEKLAHMVAHPPKKLTRAAAWPLGLAFDPEGKCIGFVMERIEGVLPLSYVYHPGLRRRYAKGFHWHLLHETARNIVTTLSALHEENYIIGDFKPENWLVDDQGHVTCIDVDSLQLKSEGVFFSCDVVSSGFTPPEILKHPANKKRTKESDLFGLATLLHFLLLGYHPFSHVGDPDLPLDDRILASGWSPHVRKEPFSVGILLPRLADLFEMTFAQGHEHPHKRPGLGVWQETLDMAIQDLVICPHSANHFLSERGNLCPWCDLKAHSGVDVFEALSPTEVSPFVIFKQFEAALFGEHYRDIARLWYEHDFLQHEERFDLQKDYIHQICTHVAALDRFKHLAVQKKDLDHLVRIWDEEAALRAFPCKEKIEGKTLEEYVDSLRHAARSVQQFHDVIQQAEHERSLGGISLATEEKVAYFIVGTNAKMKDRILEAKNRLTAWRAFEDAHRTQDDAQLLHLWKTEPLLHDFLPAQDLTSALEEGRKRAEKVSLFLHRYCVRAFDDESFLEDWENLGPLQKSGHLREELERFYGKEVEQLLGEARKRLEILATLKTLPQRSDLCWQIVVDVWDETLCRTHAIFFPYLSLANESMKYAQTWDMIRKALARHQYEEVRRLWNEDLYARAAIARGLKDGIQAAFCALQTWPMLKPYAFGAGIVCHGELLEVRWGWAKDVVPYCGISYRVDRFPKTLDDVQEPWHRQVLPFATISHHGAALLPFEEKRKPYVCVWSALKICGEVITFGQPLQMDPKQKNPFVSYEIKRRRFWRDPIGVLEAFLQGKRRYQLRIWSKGVSKFPPATLYGARSLAPLPGTVPCKKVVEFDEIRFTEGREETLEFALPRGENSWFTLCPHDEDFLDQVTLYHPENRKLY